MDSLTGLLSDQEGICKMNYIDLVKYARNVIAFNPKLKDQVIDILEMTREEIDSGASESYECELSELDIKELLQEDTNSEI